MTGETTKEEPIDKSFSCKGIAAIARTVDKAVKTWRHKYLLPSDSLLVSLWGWTKSEAEEQEGLDESTYRSQDRAEQRKVAIESKWQMKNICNSRWSGQRISLLASSMAGSVRQVGSWY